MKIITFSIFSLVMAMVGFFSSNNDSDDMKKNNYDDYAALWKEVRSFEEKGLPKSALEKVLEIQKKAEKDKNPPQIIKSLLHRSKYELILSETNGDTVLHAWEAEAATAAFPTQQIMYSILGELFDQKAESFQWRGRTNTEGFQNDDYETWTSSQLYEKATHYYHLSLDNKESRKIALSDFNAILEGFVNNPDQDLYPTLYDLLANRAVDFFRNERNYLTQPVYAFEIRDTNLLADARKFTDIKVESKDTSSGKLQVLQLFQELLKWRLSRSNEPDALLEIDMKRIDFVNEQAVYPEKEKHYEKALLALADQYKKSKGYSEITYKIALIYNQKAQTYSSANPTTRYDNLKALEWCDKGIKAFPKSYGATLCRNLVNGIKNPDMSLNIEKNNTSDAPFKGLVSYKNISKVGFRIYKLKNTDAAFQIDENNFDAAVRSLKKVADFETPLPVQNDYQNHNVEVKIPALTKGKYVLYMESRSDKKKLLHGYSVINVTDLAYWQKKNNDNFEVFVVDRTTGKPVKGAKVELFNMDYSNSGKAKLTLRHSATSDETGLAEFKGIQGSFQPKITYKDDILLPDDYLYAYRNYERDRGHRSTQFFTDRSIYRPGQTIYFKGYAMNIDGDQMPSILTNQTVEVGLFDVNGKEVEKKTFISNEFGTFNGSFTTPVGVLAGSMTIRTKDGSGSQNIQVEEYKRPTFEVTFDPFTDVKKVYDDVEIKGKAMMYAGVPLDQAQVRYRVNRSYIMPYYNYWWKVRWMPYNAGSNMEIANGVIQSEKDGSFKIPFKAIPDESISGKTNPMFSYTISVDVSDISGETHTQSTTLQLGYSSIRINAAIPQTIDRDSIKPVGVNIQNMAGQVAEGTVNVKISKLETPSRTFRKRMWEEPDTFIMSREEYYKAFPYDVYKDEDQPDKWKVQKVVSETKVTSSADSKVSLSPNAFEAGVYLVEITTIDKDKQPISEKYFMTVNDVKNKKIGDLATLWLDNKEVIYQPGDSVPVNIGTTSPKIQVLYELVKDNKIVKREWIELSGLKSFKIPVEEKDRGNFSYQFTGVYGNRYFTRTETVQVPWKNKELDIEYGTFRDKLAPGQEEEWILKVKGKNGDKVAAEMLASMYDASLDAFLPHNWYMALYPSKYSYFENQSRAFNLGSYISIYNHDIDDVNDEINGKNYPILNFFGLNVNYGSFQMLREPVTGISTRGYKNKDRANAAPMAESAVENKASGQSKKSLADKTAGASDEERKEGEHGIPPPPPPPPGQPQNIRTNLKETVFFFPDLKTDKDGNVIIRFKMNEALTKWKFMALAHTKTLEYGLSQRTITTSKDVMVTPNAPRFFREGDQITFAGKVSNTTDKEIKGTATLELLDAVTLQPIDKQLGNNTASVPFNVKGKESARLEWNIQIPKGMLQAVTYRMTAKAGSFFDGEENTLPTITNRMLVTESMPLNVRGGKTQKYEFKRLSELSKSPTLTSYNYVLEYTPNPAWYAVQALPYLMEYPHECSEQIFSRLYANSLAKSVVDRHPNVQRVFNQWKNTQALESNLSKNQELKSVLLQETPWVYEAESESQQKKDIALLFDLNKMSSEFNNAVEKLKSRQYANGGFPWFPGDNAPPSWYITQYIVEGFGHLDHLKVKDIRQNPAIAEMVTKGIAFCDQSVIEYYTEIEKNVAKKYTKWEDNHLSSLVIHYLYTRSYFPENKPSGKLVDVIKYFEGQATKYWTSQSIYMAGMIALEKQRNGDKKTAASIVKSLKEKSLTNDELGMYWKYESGYYWYEAPIETHALMIEVFDEVANDQASVENLRIWLLKNKQTNRWSSTKSTASAVFALLCTGDNWLAETKAPTIELGGSKLVINPSDMEAGTGYFKKSWQGSEIKPAMANVKITNNNKVVSWGSLYWQYFEDLDKIKSFKETPLKINKAIFREENTDRGPVLKPVTEGMAIHPGDRIKVRIEIRVDRAMEYVHMRDMRASGFEPVNVLSSYKWQDRLGYYESTGDVATNFFFDYLPKGTYVFEYPLFAVHKGTFSNGITTLQCMYAPEFLSHSEGITVKIK